MTFSGGSANAGTIFRMNTNGSNFVLLYSFPGGSGGQNPRCALTPSGSFLYGMTTLGGSGGPGVNDYGTIFRINSDGTAFTQLHIFDGSGIEGGRPFGSLTISGQFLYGITAYGGENNSGTLFRINIDGSGYTVLHNFAPAAYPSGSLTLSGSILCGMTGGDGVYSRGTIFSIAVDGTGFTTIHDFFGGTNDGWGPTYGSLTIFQSKLYGMTYRGGFSDSGTIFSMNTDGTSFAVIHGFADNTNDGQHPQGSLTLIGSRFFGMTQDGGAGNMGTVFSINTDGTNFNLIHSFVGPTTDGASPFGDVTPSTGGSTLYGMTSSGGTAGNGVVFSAAVPSVVALTPMVLSITRASSNKWHLECTGVPGTNYRIEFSPDLSVGSFTTLAMITAGAQGTFSYDDVTTDSKKFYRLAYP